MSSKISLVIFLLFPHLIFFSSYLSFFFFPSRFCSLAFYSSPLHSFKDLITLTFSSLSPLLLIFFPSIPHHVLIVLNPLQSHFFVLYLIMLYWCSDPEIPRYNIQLTTLHPYSLTALQPYILTALQAYNLPSLQPYNLSWQRVVNKLGVYQVWSRQPRNVTCLSCFDEAVQLVAPDALLFIFYYYY